MPTASSEVSNKIVSWYLNNARDLPWRKTNDPYKIWISEIILQQTTVAQGTAYYINFLETFPTVFDLASSSIDEVLKLWQGLGYYTRARNLHLTAQYIVAESDGKFPDTYEDLLKLRGIGPYTAAAIASFCYKIPKVVVDGNVIRVISRIFGIEKAVDSASVLQEIKKHAQDVLGSEAPEVFNQAIMEFGAIQCTSKNPSCQSCVLMDNCKAFKKKLVSKIPLKSKKLTKRKRYFQYAFIVDTKGNTFISKRTKKDIWHGLNEFPLIEKKEPSFDKIPLLRDFGFDISAIEVKSSKIFKHLLTHQTIFAQFYKYTIDGKLTKQLSDKYTLVSTKKLNIYAWPKLIDLYLSDLSITLF